jgi:hypothetical protein
MSMSIMITSSSEDLTIIKSTKYLIDWVDSILHSEITIPDFRLSDTDISELKSHYNSIYNILTTSGMSYDDYKSSIDNID